VQRPGCAFTVGGVSCRFIGKQPRQHYQLAVRQRLVAELCGCRQQQQQAQKRNERCHLLPASGPSGCSTPSRGGDGTVGGIGSCRCCSSRTSCNRSVRTGGFHHLGECWLLLDDGGWSYMAINIAVDTLTHAIVNTPKRSIAPVVWIGHRSPGCDQPTRDLYCHGWAILVTNSTAVSNVHSEVSLSDCKQGVMAISGIQCSNEGTSWQGPDLWFGSSPTGTRHVKSNMPDHGFGIRRRTQQPPHAPAPAMW
jgi:hypothetical protein